MSKIRCSQQTVPREIYDNSPLYHSQLCDYHQVAHDSVKWVDMSEIDDSAHSEHSRTPKPKCKLIAHFMKILCTSHHPIHIIVAHFQSRPCKRPKTSRLQKPAMKVESCVREAKKQGILFGHQMRKFVQWIKPSMISYYK